MGVKKRHGISEEYMTRAKEQIKHSESLLLTSAMWSFGLFFGEFWSVKFIEARVLMKTKSSDLRETH